MSMEQLSAAANAGDVKLWLGAGLHVFPCCPETKKPLIQGWRTLSSGDALSNSLGAQPPCDAGA